MANAITHPEHNPPRFRGMMFVIIAALVLAGAGFGSTFLGFWSPSALLHREAAPAKDASFAVEFVNIPPVEVIVPGPNSRTLIVQAVIETDAAHRSQVEHLMPRISDLFTAFLSGVDPAAYQRRGVLEVIRAELVTRARLVLGEESVRDLLITEFRFK